MRGHYDCSCFSRLMICVASPISADLITVCRFIVTWHILPVTTTTALSTLPKIIESEYIIKNLTEHHKLNFLFVSYRRILSCGILETPRFGRKSNFQFTPGAVVTFECNEGFFLNGDRRRTCGEDGHWDIPQYGYTECLRKFDFFFRTILLFAFQYLSCKIQSDPSLKMNIYLRVIALKTIWHEIETKLNL